MSVRDRLEYWFVEAAEKMKKEQLLFLKRAMYSVNELVKYVGRLHYRRNPKSERNLITCTFRDLKAVD